jgi:hypothetical protein
MIFMAVPAKKNVMVHVSAVCAYMAAIIRGHSSTLHSKEAGYPADGPIDISSFVICPQKSKLLIARQTSSLHLGHRGLCIYNSLQEGD